MKTILVPTLIIASLLNLLSSYPAIAQQIYLDTTFGTNGIVSTEKFEPRAVFIQEDGKILVGGGLTSQGQPTTCILLRFNQDGSPDTGFGTDGKVQVYALGTSFIIGIFQKPSGVIQAMGDGFDFFQFDNSGAIDTSFGAGGIYSPVVGNNAKAYQMRLLPDGKIVAAGYCRISNLNQDIEVRMLVVRFNEDLSLDTGFSDDGRYVGGTRYYAVAKTFDTDIDGNIVIGTAYSGQYSYMLKLTQAGVKDTTFGNSGAQSLDLAAGTENLNYINILPDGKIILTGHAGTPKTVVHRRLLPNGDSDSSYGNSGLFTVANNSANDLSAVTPLVLNDSTALTGLNYWNGTNYDIQLMISSIDGFIDSSSGENGFINTPIEGNQTLTCLVAQPDGKIVAAGFDEDEMVLMRYNISVALNTDDFIHSAVKIFPNPATDRITITNLPDNVKISLLNLSGQMLLEAVGSGEINLDISSLAGGIYAITTPNGTFKIIKK